MVVVLIVFFVMLTTMKVITEERTMFDQYSIKSIISDLG